MAWINATKRAIKAAGGTTAVAEDLSVSPQRVNNWRFRGRVPAEFVVRIEALSGVDRRKLRPDIEWD